MLFGFRGEFLVVCLFVWFAKVCLRVELLLVRLAAWVVWCI